MKKVKLFSLMILLCLSFSNLFAQDGNYSILIVKQTASSKGMSRTLYEYDIKHYVGNNMVVDLTKDRTSVDVNNIVDALNDLYKKGWKLVNVLTTGNLRSDDTDASLSGKNSTYYQYILTR